MADTIPTFGIAETDDYVRKILGRAGPLPKGKTNRELAAILLPHLIHQESRGNHAAVSPVGARGVTQVMPKTGADPGFGVAPLKDSSQGEYERFGADYLTAMLDRYKGRADLALAAYNAGPGRADKWAKRTGTKPDGSPYRAGAGIEAVTPLASVWGDLPTAQDTPKGSNFFTNVVGRDSSIAAIDRIIEDSGYEYDPSFHISDVPQNEWKQLTDGIPEEYQEGLGNAVSRAHLQTLVDRTRASVKAEEELAGYGGWGLAGRFALNMLDPASILIGVGSGGLGIANKATRLARAAKMARIAGNFAEGSVAVKALEGLAKTSRGAAMLRAGAAAGVENAAFEGFIDQGDATKDGWDVAFAGLTGLALGAGASRVFGGRELRGVQEAFLRERQAMELAEAGAALEARKIKIHGKLDKLDVESGYADAKLAEAEARRAVKEAADTAEVSAAVRGGNASEVRLKTAQDALEAHRVANPSDTSSPTYVALKNAVDTEASALSARDNLATFKETGAYRALLGDTPAVKAHEDAASALSRALGIRDERRAALEADLQAAKDGRTAQVQASDQRLAADAVGLFGEDSASAARYNGFNEGIHPELDGKDFDSGLPQIGKMKLAGAVRTGPFATFSGILRGSDNATVRNLLGRMVGNVLGEKGDGVAHIGASEHASRINESMTAKFYSAVEGPYKKWAEENGHGMIARKTRTVREQYMADLGRAIRTPGAPSDPAMAGVVAKVRGIFKDYLTQAKDAGVKGFENVEPNETYLPRVFGFNSQRHIEDRIGSDNLRLLVQKAIQVTNEDVDDALAGKIAAAYVKRMKDLRVGSDAGLMQGVKWDDVGFLRRFLGEAGVGSDEVDDVVNKFAALNAARERQTEGSFRNAKNRVQFDETFSLKFPDQQAAREGRSGEMIEVKMSDLLENNVEALFGRYTRTVSGHIGLAKVGIKSRKDFEDSITAVEHSLGSKDEDELKRVKKTADVAYKLITGQPIQDSTTMTRLGRAMRD